MMAEKEQNREELLQLELEMSLAQQKRLQNIKSILKTQEEDEENVKKFPE